MDRTRRILEAMAPHRIPAPTARPGPAPDPTRDTPSSSDSTRVWSSATSCAPRRARLKPADVGLADYGGRRRVPGLRREELAQVSESPPRTTRASNRATRTTCHSKCWTRSRVRSCSPRRSTSTAAPRPAEQRRPRPRRSASGAVHAGGAAVGDGGRSAYVWGRRTDVLAWNHTASALFGDWGARAPQERNWAGSPFSTRRPGGSSSTGSPRRTTWWPNCDLAPACTRTIRSSRP